MPVVEGQARDQRRLVDLGDRMTEQLIKMGFKASELDPPAHWQFRGVIVDVHVDDCFCIGGVVVA